MISADIVLLIERRRKQILTHGVLQLRFQQFLVPEYQLDRWCLELVELQMDFPQESLAAPLFDDFWNFPGFLTPKLLINEWADKRAKDILYG